MFFWKPKTFKIDIDYNSEAKVFTAVSDDIDGLALEADTPGQMQLYLSEVVPILLEENHNMSMADASNYRLDMNIKALTQWLATEYWDAHQPEKHPESQPEKLATA